MLRKLGPIGAWLLLAIAAGVGVSNAGLLSVQGGRPVFYASSSSGGGSLWSGYTPTLYGAPTDVGAGNCLTEATACDIAQACAALNSASAGAVLGLINGTYTLTNSASNAPACAITSGGSSGNPKRIVSKYPALYNDASPSLRTDLRLNTQDTTTWNNTPVIGVVSTNYVEILGPYINWTYSPTRPSHGVIKFDTCTGCRLSEAVVDQIVSADGDNYTTVWCSNSTSLTVSNNLFRGGYGTGNHNATTFTAYGCLSTTLEYNTCSNVNSCGFFKGSGNSNTRGNSGAFRFNKVIGASNNMVAVAVVEASAETPGNILTVQQNLAVDTGEACIKLRGDGEGAKNVQVIANTCVSSDGAVGSIIYEAAPSGSGFVLRDNLLPYMANSSGHPVNLESCGPSCFTTMNYNKYYEGGNTPVYAAVLTTYTGIAAWRTATSKEANSTEGAPNFVNAAGGNYRTTGDTGSSTGGPRGAYITGSEQIGAPGT